MSYNYSIENLSCLWCENAPAWKTLSGEIDGKRSESWGLLDYGNKHPYHWNLCNSCFRQENGEEEEEHTQGARCVSPYTMSDFPDTDSEDEYEWDFKKLAETGCYNSVECFDEWFDKNVMDYEETAHNGLDWVEEQRDWCEKNNHIFRSDGVYNMNVFLCENCGEEPQQIHAYNLEEIRHEPNWCWRCACRDYYG